MIFEHEHFLSTGLLGKKTQCLLDLPTLASWPTVSHATALWCHNSKRIHGENTGFVWTNVGKNLKTTQIHWLIIPYLCQFMIKLHIAIRGASQGAHPRGQSPRSLCRTVPGAAIPITYARNNHPSVIREKKPGVYTFWCYSNLQKDRNAFYHPLSLSIFKLSLSLSFSLPLSLSFYACIYIYHYISLYITISLCYTVLVGFYCSRILILSRGCAHCTSLRYKNHSRLRSWKHRRDFADGTWIMAKWLRDIQWESCRNPGSFG